MPYIGKAPSSGIRSRFIYTATAAQTTFTGADGTGKTLGYTDGEYVDVYLNGVLLDPADYTATSKTSVVLDSGAAVDDIVEIVVYDTFSVFNGTFTGDLTVDGDTLFVDSTNNRVGIGTSSPDATGLHVHTGSAGSLTPNSAADDLVVESNGNAGITIASPDANYSGIIFSSPTDTTGSIIEYNQSGATFDIGTATSSGVLRLRSGNFSEAMRIDSSGNLLVGKTSFDSSIAGVMFDTRVFATTSGAATTILNRLTNDGDIITFRKDGTTVGSIKSYNGAFLQIESAGDQSGLLFGTTAYFPVKNGSLDNGNIDIGNGSNRFKDLYLGGGAYIGGTGSANLLDDYEEGTWTPVYEGSTTNPSVTYNAQRRGNYTKVGNLVVANFEIITNAASGGSGSLRIAGLPFTASSTSRAGTANIAYANNMASNTHPIAGIITVSTDGMLLFARDGSDARSSISTGVATSALVDGSAKNQIIGTAIYRT